LNSDSDGQALHLFRVLLPRRINQLRSIGDAECRLATLKIDAEDLLIMKESDIIGVIEGVSATKKKAA
jgi:hypothetical protein